MGRNRLELADALAARYLDWCEAERVPANTVRRRRTVLRSLGNPGTATREQVEAWWDSRRYLKDRSRACDLACLRSFYAWCQVWEHRLDNPTIRLKPPKAPAGAPTPVTRRELDAIITHLDELVARRDRRAAALKRAVLLAAWAGLRREEAATLTWDDIDLDTRRARVTGKGRKTRLVAFSQKLIDALGDPHPGNVVTGREKGWTADTLGFRVNAAIRGAGVQKTYHKLRHRYGTVAYQRTKDPKALAQQMGHASPSTTMEFYAAAADEAALAIADAAAEDD